jgi:L-fuconolactonase
MIDAHFHIWQVSRGDYGWLTADLAPIYRDVSPSDWRAVSVPHGITGGVLVQAAPTQAETHFLLEQADAHPEVLGVVGWVDLLAADAPANITALAQHPKLKALRPMLQDIADPRWMLQDALTPSLMAMTELGLVLDLLVKPHHLPHVLSLAARHPRLSMVIDHAAKPNIAASQWEPWASLLTRIAQDTHAICKLSGLLTEAGPSPAAAVVLPWGAHVLNTFGAQRVMWGSDWPVLELAGHHIDHYAGWFEACQQMASALSPSEQADLFGGTARRTYRL